MKKKLFGLVSEKKSFAKICTMTPQMINGQPLNECHELFCQNCTFLQDWVFFSFVEIISFLIMGL